MKDIDLNILQEMLVYIPADVARDEWVSVLMSIKSEFGQNGIDAARSWSETASTYNVQGFNSAWKSIRAGGKTTIASLIHSAKQGGYKFTAISDEDKARLNDEAKKRKVQREKEAALALEERKRDNKEARVTALGIWKDASESGESPYLIKKGIKAHNAKYSPDGKTLIVPVYDVKGVLWNIQSIHANGKKLFLKGGKKSGNMHLMPTSILSNFIIVAEGYATAATLHEATGYQVAVAFDSGNLLKVVANIKKLRPDINILICADDDQATEQNIGKNPGIQAAKKTSELFNCKWVAPIFPDNREDETDFNDLAQMENGSNQLVKEQIEQAIAQSFQQTQSKPQSMEGLPTKGGRGDRPKAVSVMCLEDIVERFTHVDDTTGDYAYDSWDKTLVRLKKVQGLFEPKVRWDDIKSHPEWVSKAIYLDEVGFDPTEKDPKVKCNLWSGWKVKPKKGSCELLLMLLEYLCAGEKNHKEINNWILNWLAYPLQNPGAKLKTSIGMHGGQGTGKSMFFEAVSAIYDIYGVVLHQDALEDSFNSDWTSRKLFVVADEVVAKNDKYNIKNKLKGYITGSTIRVNTKQVAAHSEKNQMNMVFLSNEYNMLVIEADDRRHCIIKTPEKLQDEFYKQTSNEINNGGIEALYDYLLNRDLGDFNPDTKPPMTQAKMDLIHVNLDSPELFIRAWVVGDTDYPVCPARSVDLYKAYENWCKKTGEAYKFSQVKFSNYIKNKEDWEVERKRYRERYIKPGEQDYGDAKKKLGTLIIPGSKVIEKAKEIEDLIVKEKSENQTDESYYTDSILTFKRALDEIA